MRADSTSLCNGDASFAVINACYVLTDQYRCILSDLGKEHHLTENEMLVLVHLALYPDARTQKKLQATNLPLSSLIHLPHGGFSAEKRVFIDLPG